MVSVPPEGGQFTSTALTLSFHAYALTRDGRYVLFLRGESNGDWGSSGHYVRDTCADVPSCAPATAQVGAGVFSDLGSQGTAVDYFTPDARYLLRSSWTYDPIHGIDTAAEEIFDSCTGAAACTPAPVFQLPSTGGVEITPAARYVLVEDHANVDGVWATLVSVYDTCLGAASCVPQVRWSADQPAYHATMVGEAAAVAFSSADPTLVAADTNGLADIFLYITCLGAPGPCSPAYLRVSLAHDGAEPNASSGVPSVSATGRYVTFVSEATNLVPGDTNGVADIFLRDTCLGAPAGCVPSTIRISVSSTGVQANLGSVTTGDAISADGRYVVFESPAATLVAGDSNGAGDVFLRDTCIGATGCTPSTVRVSVTEQGVQGNDRSFAPLIGADGRHIVFTSLASNLVENDANGREDLFMSHQH